MSDLYPTPSSKFFFLTVILIVSLFLSFQSMMTRNSGLVVNFGVGELCIFVVLKFIVAVNQHFITYLNCCSRMSHKKKSKKGVFIWAHIASKLSIISENTRQQEHDSITCTVSMVQMPRERDNGVAQITSFSLTSLGLQSIEWCYATVR